MPARRAAGWPRPENPQLTRKWLATFAKLAISIGLVAVLVANIDLDRAAARIAQLAWWAVVAGLALLVLQVTMLGTRWRLVSKILRAPVDAWRAVALMFVGQLFSQALPSTVGGDAVRVLVLNRAGLPLKNVIHGVLIDRVTGVAGMFLLVLIAQPLLYELIADRTAYWGLFLVNLCGLTGVGAFLAIDRLPARWHLWRPVAALVAFSADGRRVFFDPRRTPPIMLLAVAVQLINVVIVFLLGRGLGLDIALVECFALVPPVLLLATVPVSLAGWGLREGAMVAALGFVGVAAADAVVLSVLYGLGLLVAALPGALFWLGDWRKNAGAANKAEVRADE